VGIKILESGGLTKPEESGIAYFSTSSIIALHVLATSFCTKASVHTDTNGTFRAERGEENIPTEVSQ
jgi:hypothetical protein